MQNTEPDRIAGRKAADGAGELAGILDRQAIHRSNDITVITANSLPSGTPPRPKRTGSL